MPLSSYEKIVIALRHGILVQEKATTTMRYGSDVTYLTALPSKGDFGADGFTVVPIEAADVPTAARRIAEITARERYGEKAVVTNVHYIGHIFRPGAAQDVYRASIGVQKFEPGKCVNVGSLISIRIYPVD